MSDETQIIKETNSKVNEGLTPSQVVANAKETNNKESINKATNTNDLKQVEVVNSEEENKVDNTKSIDAKDTPPIIAEKKDINVIDKTKVTIEGDSKELSFLKIELDKYQKLNDGLMANEKRRKEAILSFQSIVDRIAKATSKEVIDEVFNYFKENRNKFLSEEYALQGIETIESKRRMRIEIIYAAMNMVIAGKKVDVGTIETTFKNQVLVQWFIQKNARLK